MLWESYTHLRLDGGRSHIRGRPSVGVRLLRVSVRRQEARGYAPELQYHPELWGQCRALKPLQRVVGNPGGFTEVLEVSVILETR